LFVVSCYQATVFTVSVSVLVAIDEEETVGWFQGGKKKRWRLWKSSSAGESRSQDFDYGSVASDSFTAAVATVVRAPPKDFKLLKQEWAATRIQTAFRAFLVCVTV